MNEQELSLLPPDRDLETKEILKQLAKTNRALAELKGYAETIPNKNILINAVTINEAKDSSAIENIITTHDDLYKAMNETGKGGPAAREVISYRSARTNQSVETKFMNCLFVINKTERLRRESFYIIIS